MVPALPEAAPLSMVNDLLSFRMLPSFLLRPPVTPTSNLGSGSNATPLLVNANPSDMVVRCPDPDLGLLLPSVTLFDLRIEEDLLVELLEEEGSLSVSMGEKDKLLSPMGTYSVLGRRDSAHHLCVSRRCHDKNMEALLMRNSVPKPSEMAMSDSNDSWSLLMSPAGS